MAFSGLGGVWGYKQGDFQGTNYPGTQAGIQLALDTVGNGGHVWLGPGLYTGITNLTMHAKTTLIGAGTLSTQLYRSAAATGTMLREKTVGEGNTGGGTGITVEKLSFWGGAGGGNGIDFGNQGGASFNANAQLVDILVRDFTAGTGIKLLANAIHCRNIWAANCSIGVYLNYNAGGGANHLDGLWSEQCSDTHLKVEQPWNTFTHVQIEQSGGSPTGPLIDLAISNADRNVFAGVYLAITNPVTNLIVARTGVIGTQFYGVRVVAGAAYTNTIYTEGTATGTGAKDWIGFFNDMSSSGTHYMNDQSLGEQTIFTGARPTFPQATIGTLAVTGTSSLTGNVTGGVAGTGYTATFGQGTTGNDSGTVTARSANGAASIAQFLLNQNNSNVAGMRYANGVTFFDHGGTLGFRSGISGPNTASLTTAGDFAAIRNLATGSPGTLTVGGGDAIAKIQANVYTPTRSAEANMDSNVTMSEAQFVRIGNTVTVSGRFTADPTLVATATSFEMTLPVASNLANAEDVSGTAVCGSIASMCAEVIGVAANDTAKVQWIATDLTSKTWSYTFTYQVI